MPSQTIQTLFSYRHAAVLTTATLFFLTACQENASSSLQSSLYKTDAIQNTSGAYIPAQCYTKTKGKDGRIHNACFSCHTQSVEPNYINDGHLQITYAFHDAMRRNPWINLFKDRSKAVANITDHAMISYVRQSNYLNPNGTLILARKLANLPNEWDVNHDHKWNGYTPDCYYHFDNAGFDQTPDGQDTGWRTFGYAPFTGNFWPTNGSMDDVLIRLALPFRQNENGKLNRKVYQLNLAIVEALIKRKNILIPITDETLYGVDLNHNGFLDKATEVAYQWAPNKGIYMSYVGKAKQLLNTHHVHLAAGLYPEGTEFLHSVRYIDFDDHDNIKMANRMKELRYGIKKNWDNYTQLRLAALKEIKESDQTPDRLRKTLGNAETGLLNDQGWTYQGFIEDQHGQLRPQNYEETLSCIGCHSGIGATTDSSFALPRKFDNKAFHSGWYHWTQKGLKGTPEPKWSGKKGEYTQYLLENQAGSEFRNNSELMAKFFNADGKLKSPAIQTLHQDIGYLLLPSTKRALSLNKAYKVIVNEQSYIYGRTGHVHPLNETVWQQVPENELTGVKKVVRLEE